MVRVVALLILSTASCAARRSAEPSLHRPAAQECARQRAPGQASARGGMCKSDAECNAGKNGRCTAHAQWRMDPVNRCSYDGCFVDTDCDQGVCECGHDAASDTGGNHYCSAPGNCKVDRDCGAGGFCSPSYALCSHSSGADGYFCHTSRDECNRNEDCPKKEQKNWSFTQTACIYSAPRGRWVCASEGCPVG